MTDEKPTSTSPATSATKRPRAYRKSGVFRLKRALKERGLKALDGRSSLARSIVEWRGAVAAHLVELLKVLGLRRKARELPSLSQYVSGKKQEPAA